SVDTIRALNRAGLAVVVVTNQSGIARAYFNEAFVGDTHRVLSSRLAEGGARIDAYYYCPHHPDGSVAQYAQACDCRKPARGLVDRAVREFEIDPARCFVVGDRWLDIALARAVNAKGVLVRTGYGVTEEFRPPDNLTADAIADNLIGAVAWILRQC